MKGRAGFTLIEVMICIAILAIVLAVPMSSRADFGWLAAETDYSEALRNARWQIDQLQKMPFEALPPRVVQVPASGVVQLQPHLVPASVRLEVGRVPGWRPRPSWATWPGVNAERGIVHMPASMRGRTVAIDYSFQLPVAGECHTVPDRPPFEVHLDGAPIEAIDRLYLAQGDNLMPLAAGVYHAHATSGAVDVPRSMYGRVVVADYLGTRLHNIVSGRFLRDDTLQQASVATHTKLLRIEESYGEKINHFSMDTLRVQP